MELQFVKMENDWRMGSRDDYIVETQEWEGTDCNHSALLHSIPINKPDAMHLTTIIMYANMDKE